MHKFSKNRKIANNCHNIYLHFLLTLYNWRCVIYASFSCTIHGTFLYYFWLPSDKSWLIFMPYSCLVPALIHAKFTLYSWPIPSKVVPNLCLTYALILPYSCFTPALRLSHSCLTPALLMSHFCLTFVLFIPYILA